MKAVPRLAGEPPGLTGYRATNPDDVSAPPARAKSVWNRFRDAPAYQEVREHLIAAQSGLCAYCEQRLTDGTGTLIALDQQLEHVLPKSGGVARTLDWTNLVLCCGGGTCAYHRDRSRYSARARDNISCGQAKGEEALPPGCDPRTFPRSARLVHIDLDGTMRANQSACTAHGIDPQALERTIDKVLKLNCERLRAARSKIIANLLDWQVELLRELLDATHLTLPEIAAMRKLFVAGRLRRDAHGHLRAFWTTERQCLEPDADKWMAQNEAAVYG